MKKILLLLGHPAEHSLCGALLKAYGDGAWEAGAEVRELWVGGLRFDPNLGDGYAHRETMPLEPDLQRVQEHLTWADHLVLAFPVWWGGPPALLKALLERVLLPGFAFRYRAGQALPDQLLRGKSARVLATMDAPKPWFYLVYGAAPYRTLRQQVLGFCGARPVRFSTFGRVRRASPCQRAGWLQQAEALGRQLR